MNAKWFTVACAGLLVVACGSGEDSVVDGSAGSSSGGSAGSAGESRPPACQEQDKVVQATLDEARITPNAVVAVRNELCGLSTYASGDPADATTDSIFLLASVTKTYVAAAVMSLVGENRLQLDAPINTWITGLDPVYDGVTVRMLLNHTSGIFNYTDDFRLYSEPNRVWPPQELIELALEHPPIASPGTEVHYSSTNFILLGLILETVEGKTVGAVLRERAIEPGGLKQTFFTAEETVIGQMATPFSGSGDVIEDLYDPSFLWAAGSMVATAGDTATWVWELYRARSVIDTELVQQMIDDAVVMDPFPLETDSKYGFGTCVVELADTYCGTGVGHNGRWQWTSVDAFYFADCDTSVVVMQNVLLNPPIIGVERVLTKVLNALVPPS